MNDSDTPLDVWLRQDHVRRKVVGYVNGRRSVTVVMAWEGVLIKGIGEGRNIAEASANCCNDIMAKEHADGSNPVRPRRL